VINRPDDELTLEVISQAVAAASAVPAIQPIRGWRLWITPYWRDPVTRWPVNPLANYYLFAPPAAGAAFWRPVRSVRSPGSSYLTDR
jgi:hypothetical protein